MILREEKPTEKAPSVRSGSSRGVKTVGQTLISRVAIQGLNAGTGVLTARLLLPAGRGELAAITLWSQFLAGLVSFGLPSALIFYIRSRPERTRELLGSALGLSTLLSVVVGVIGAFCMPSWLRQYPPWAIHTAQWFLLVTPLCSAVAVLRAALEANNAFTTSNFAQLLNPVATLAFLLVLLALHRFNTFTASCAYIFAIVPVLTLLVWQARHLLVNQSLPSVSSSRLLLTYGLRSYGIDLLGTLALQVDQVLVVAFLKPSDLGVYVVMLSLSRVLNVFQASVVMVLFPKAAGLSQDVAVALTVRAARVSLFLTGACAAAIALIGPGLLQLFYGKAYVHAVGSLRLLLLEVTISGCVFVLAQAFMALNRPGTVTLLQALGLALSVPLMLLLIPRLGILGAAFALLISTCTRFIFIYFAFKFTLRVPLPSLLPQKEDLDMVAGLLRRMNRKQAA